MTDHNLNEACDKLRLTPMEFLETAYVWRFKKQGHVIPDLCVWMTEGIVPKYAQLYMDFLEGGDPS